MHEERCTRMCEGMSKVFISNSKVSKEAMSLSSIYDPAKIWSLIVADIIGSLKKIQVVYLRHNRPFLQEFSEAETIPDKSAKSVAQFLCSV